MGRVEGDKVAFDKMVDCGTVKRNYKVGESVVHRKDEALQGIKWRQMRSL